MFRSRLAASWFATEPVGLSTASSILFGVLTAATSRRFFQRAQAKFEEVVPEEIDNVDEMMVQFQGREEELVEQLQTMQERAVAQKARQELQKRSAKQSL